MKEGRPLPILAAELERQANTKRDYLAYAGEIALRSNGHSEMMLGDAYPVTDIAHSQLADYLEIPKAFYDRLRERTDDLVVRDASGEASQGDPTLFDTVVNTMLASKGAQRRLVRTLDGRARAFLSDSFNVDLDNHDVFVFAAKAMLEAGIGPENVLSAEVTERRLYIKAVSPRLQAEISPENLRTPRGMLKEPQLVQAGFVLTNSETGLGSLRVNMLAFKLQCANGWIREESVWQRHVGRSLESDGDGAVYRSDTRAQDAKLRLMKVRDHIAAALDVGAFQEFAARMQESACVRLEGAPDKCVEATAKRFGLSQSEKDQVLRELIEGADLSLWGLTNAVTATAQKVGSYDRATELEQVGGKFFSLTRGEVRELVAGTR